MKVALEKDYRRLYTLEDLERAKAVIAWEKDDDYKPADWAKMAVGEFIRYAEGSTWGLQELLKAEAHTAKNCRVMNAYGDDTGDMDIWISFTADLGNTILKGGAYLSDIWLTGSTKYFDEMYKRIFVEWSGN